MWEILRSRQFLGYKFRRQHPIGSFVLDFYCSRYRFGIELDGNVHDDDAAQVRDSERTRLLNGCNIEIVRFRNDDITFRPETILEQLSQRLSELSGLQVPLHLVERDLG
jgi:very-short-patch-repair endonuclease